ncbi:MAG: hypothetical protein AAGD86_05785, partial [Pseudomonadota bacterium]
VATLPLLKRMHEAGDGRLVTCDPAGTWRFNADLANAGDLDARLDALVPTYGDELEALRDPLRDLYEAVFDHRSFTGRSGGMFGFEGLGCIYWHMVSKLLLAVQENFFAAREQGAAADVVERLGALYYRVRAGLGFNKSPAEYGAFPTDPYSHTPGHAGAQQPGMTGQVKEEMLTRFAELGVRVRDGAVRFDPALLRPVEFLTEPAPFRYLAVDGAWQTLGVPANGLAFTWCQVPIVYRLGDSSEDVGITVTFADGERQLLSTLSLPRELAAELFRRSGRLKRLDLCLGRELLFAAP